MTRKAIKVSVDRILSPEQLLQAVEKAVNENATNTRRLQFFTGCGSSHYAAS